MTEQSYAYAYDIWISLCTNAGISMDDARHLYQRVHSKYLEKQRHYHDWSHIKKLLSLYECYYDEFKDPLSIGFAIFFHDVIYETDGKIDNEGLSAVFAKQALSPLGVHDQLIHRINDLILSTKTHHLDNLEDSDASLFLDMDMSVLSCPTDDYMRYVSQIRQEYNQFSDDAFQKGRSQFLEATLNQPSVFHTKHFQDRYDEQAYQNMQAELRGYRP